VPQLVDLVFVETPAQDPSRPLAALSAFGVENRTDGRVLRTPVRGRTRDLDAIVPKLRELGGRHVAYDARPEHYPVVGAALIASMAEVAGDPWTPAYEAAWAAAFEIVAGAMLEGAEAAALEAAA
jgi:hypothetical protein